MRFVIWGAGAYGQLIAYELRREIVVEQNSICEAGEPSRWGRAINQHILVAFIDRNEELMEIDGVPVFPPRKLAELEYDQLIVAAKEHRTEIIEQALNLGVPAVKINHSYMQKYVYNRVNWVREYAETFPDEPGSVAEAGVYRGEFAKEINAAFPDKKLYLFDTFSGFSADDITHETFEMQRKIESKYRFGDFSDTSAELVRNKLPYPDKVIIKAGYFPDSAAAVADTFCFVNLDMDLAQPTLAGLRFFAPKLTGNGVILVHDYFGFAYGDSIKRAIAEFIKTEKIAGNSYRLLPIGDRMSIAVLKR